MPESAFSIAAITGAFLLSGIVKGVVGMGLPAVAMGLLGLVMPSVQAVALLVVPALVTNVWQLAAGPTFTGAVKRFATMMVGVCIGTPFGIGLLTGGMASAATAALGGVLAVYGAIGLGQVRFRVSPSSERWLSPFMGFLTGVLTGATGVSVIPVGPYLSALGLEKEELIQTLGLSFTVSTVALAIGLAASGRFHASVAGGSFLALLPVLCGMFFGQRIRYRLRPEVFRRWFFTGLLMLGGYILFRALVSA